MTFFWGLKTPFLGGSHETTVLGLTFYDPFWGLKTPFLGGSHETTVLGLTFYDLFWGLKTPFLGGSHETTVLGLTFYDPFLGFKRHDTSFWGPPEAWDLFGRRGPGRLEGRGRRDKRSQWVGRWGQSRQAEALGCPVFWGFPSWTYINILWFLKAWSCNQRCF